MGGHSKKADRGGAHQQVAGQPVAQQGLPPPAADWQEGGHGDGQRLGNA